MRPKLTKKWLTALVAIAVLVLAGVIWSSQMTRLSELYRQRAKEHELSQIDQQAKWDERNRSAEWAETNGQESAARVFREEADRVAVAVSRHSLLRQKYERAAARPWLPLEPDPK